MEKYKSVFDKDIGKISNLQASIVLKENVSPIFIKSRTVPFSLVPKVNDEIDYLVSQGILEKVNHSDWATPIVPVVKSNGRVRLCGDFKVNFNS